MNGLALCCVICAQREYKRLQRMQGSTGTYREGHVLNAKLLDTATIQLPQDAHDAGLLPRPRGSVHHEVGEIPTLDLHKYTTTHTDDKLRARVRSKTALVYQSL